MSPKSKVITNYIRAKCARSASCMLFVSQFAHCTDTADRLTSKDGNGVVLDLRLTILLCRKKKNQRERKVPFHDDSADKLNKMFVRIPAGR